MAENDPHREPAKDPRRLPSSERPRVWPRYSVEQLTCKEDDAGRKFCYLPNGRPVCGRLRKSGNRVIENEACLGQPMKSGPCRVHGGASPGGQLTANGRYSRVLKTWKPAFERALKDKDLLDTRRDLALMDSAIEQLLARIAEADSPGWRAELERIYGGLDAAVRSGRQREVGPFMKKLGEQIRQGAKVDAAVADLMQHIDRRARRAHKINELEVRRDERLTVREVALVFAELIEMLQRQLGMQEYARLIPHIDALVKNSRAHVAGSAAQREAEVDAAQRLQELRSAAKARPELSGSHRG